MRVHKQTICVYPHFPASISQGNISITAKINTILIEDLCIIKTIGYNLSNRH